MLVAAPVARLTGFDPGAAALQREARCLLPPPSPLLGSWQWTASTKPEIRMSLRNGIGATPSSILSGPARTARPAAVQPNPTSRSLGWPQIFLNTAECSMCKSPNAARKSRAVHITALWAMRATMVVISLLLRRVRSIQRGLTLGSRMGMRTSRLEPSRSHPTGTWRDGMSRPSSWDPRARLSDQRRPLAALISREVRSRIESRSKSGPLCLIETLSRRNG